ncbi:MAG: hypothetical protein MJ094_01090 [Saccharofermentans sp.]|nr:hypothetical protein [Saccharofermentans sp.]
MKFKIANNQLIIRKLFSSVKLSPSDIDIIDCSGAEVQIKTKSGTTYALKRIDFIMKELEVLNFVYKNRIGFVSLDFNEMDSLYLESELDDKLLENLERIRVIGLPLLREKFGLGYDLLIVPKNEGAAVSVGLGAVSNGYAVKFNNPYSDNGMMDELYVFVLARITPINGECLFALARDFDSDKELEETLKDIIAESELV